VDEDDNDDDGAPPLPNGGKNYLTQAGHDRLRAELHALLRVERPKVVEVVSWAAGNGDRSENGDYLYGKKRLREIDRRARFLTKRLEIAEVVDPAAQTRRDRIYFGATVTFATERDEQRTVTILGVDEADLARGEVSLHAPIARALLGARVGDLRHLATPAGPEEIEVLGIRYPDA
jgi:transcription elongation factor GreB